MIKLKHVAVNSRLRLISIRQFQKKEITVCYISQCLYYSALQAYRHRITTKPTWLTKELWRRIQVIIIFPHMPVMTPPQISPQEDIHVHIHNNL